MLCYCWSLLATRYSHTCMLAIRLELYHFHMRIKCIILSYGTGLGTTASESI